MSVSSGTRLGAYEVGSLLGVGGMGEVYRARDTKLDRDVAIKVLPESFAADPERVARFEREAKTLASLNHPNIAAIYGFEDSGSVRALVLELVEGETLDERIRRPEGLRLPGDGSGRPSGLPIDEALSIARQIADALEAAHEHGIVHRDLKPANIKVRSDGTVKVLDFGLAKAFGPADHLRQGSGGQEAGPYVQPPVGAGFSRPDLTASPTLSLAATRMGMILGTAAYMSPEQAKGRAVDKRTDIWAFGCVLYEMLSGRRPFDGEDVTDVLSRVLQRDPDFDALPATTPRAVRKLLRRCLQKDPRSRLRDIGDAKAELDEPADEASDLVSAGSRRTSGRQMRLVGSLVGALLATAVVASLATWWLGRPQPAPPRSVVHATIPLPAKTEVGRNQSNGRGANVAISLDGTRVVYSAAAGDRSQLYARSLDRPETMPIPGTEDGRNPFFSPDGQWIGFFAGGQLKKVPVGGGAPVTICAAAFAFGAAWSEDGTIVFAGNLQGGLSRVSAEGGAPQPFTTLAKGEGSHRWPALVSGSRDVLFAVAADVAWNDAQLAVQPPDGSEHRIILTGGTNPRYVPTGHIVFARAGSLLAVPFDPVRRETVGPPVSLVKDVNMTALGGDAQYAVSADGTLVYLPGGPEDFRRSLVWVDRKGTAQTLPVAARGFQTPRISPDGQRVALTVREADADIWVLELGRGTVTRVTDEAGEDHSAVWAPDSQRVTYSATREGRSRVTLTAADGAGRAEELFVADRHRHLGGWAPDGRTLVMDGDGNGGSDLYAVSPSEKSPPRVYIQTEFNEGSPQLSPDGRWVAYTSNQSGRPEVYVQPFPGPGGRSQVSTDGGSEPVWARSGRELFYRNGNTMLAVIVETGSTFKAGAPRALFEGEYARVEWFDANYDVSLDGRRFLMLKSEAQSPATELHLVVNWIAELQRAGAGR